MNPIEKKPYVPQRVADINAEIERQGNKGYSVAPSAPTYVPPINQPITSASLSSTETPITLPEPKISTTASGISGASTAIIEEADKMDALKREMAKETADREAKLAETEAKQFSLLEKIGLAKKEQTTKGREEFGLDTLEPTRRKALQDLRTSQVRELAEINAIPPNATGHDAMVSAIQRKHGMEQLEAQLSYHLANDDITAAEKTIADRITLETEPLYAQLDLTKNVYNQISQSLSKSEDREWNLAIDTIKQKISQTEDLTKYKGDIAITASKNGTPLDSYTQMKINRATSIDEVNQVLAEQGVNLQSRQTQVIELPSGAKALIDSRSGEIIQSYSGSSSDTNRIVLPNIGGLGTLGEFIPDTKLTASQKQKVNTVVAGIDLINQAEKLYTDAVGQEYSGFGSGVVSRLKGLMRFGGGLSGTNEKWKAYQNFLDSNRAPIAKGIKGEVGNLAEQEQQNALKSFPGSFSSPYEARVAFEAIRSQSQSNLRTLGTLETMGTQQQQQTTTLSPDQFQELVDLGLIQ